MTARRPPSLRDPKNYGQRLSNGLRAMSKGSDSGRVLNAGPVSSSSAAFSVDVAEASDTNLEGATLFAHDRFAITTTTPTLTLTQTPLVNSAHVYLNGLEQDEGADYTLTDRTVVCQTAMGAASGDVIDCRYAYSDDGTSTIVPYSTSGWKYLIPAYTDTTDYSSPTFDDSAWATGSTIFGHGTSFTPVTAWGTSSTHSKIWLRRVIPSGQNFTVRVKVDDNATVYWNGTSIGTAVLGVEAVLPVPSSAVVAGTQLLAVMATDDLVVEGYIDVRLDGQLL